MTQENRYLKSQESISEKGFHDVDSVQGIGATLQPASGLYTKNLTDLPVDLASLLRALWRRKVWILVIWLLFSSAAAFLALTATPVYESRAALELKTLPALPKSDLHSETSMSKVTEKKYMEAMKRLLSSRKLALMVITELGLHLETEASDSGEQITDRAGLSEKELKSAHAGAFQSMLSVSIEKGGVTGVINLSYLDGSPKKAADILSTLIDQFWLIIYERPEIAFSKERNHIAQMISQAQEKLDHAYDTLNMFLSENDIFFLENVDVMTKKDIEITSSQLLELSKKAEQASHERIQAEVVLNQARSNPEGIAEVTASPLIMLLKEELAKALASEADMTAVYTSGHSSRQAISAKIISLKQAIEREKKNIIQTIAHTFEKAVSKEKDLLGRVEKMKDYVIRKKALKGEYDAIEAEIEINRKVYQSVLQQYEALKIETVFPFTLNMIDPPLVPTKPLKPNKGFLIILGMTIGIVFGASIALLMEFTNPGLRAPIEAERRTGLPMLGAVPSMRVRKEFRTMDDQEQFSHLGAWPEFNQSFSNPAGIILSSPGLSISITSPESDEGKTVTAVGICLQLIRAGKKVLLIDGDFLTSNLERLFYLEQSSGLLDILETMVREPSHKCRLDQLPVVAESAGGGKLYAMKTGMGQVHSTPLGLIETPSFIDMLAQYKNEADYIIFITPPMLREVATYIINRATNTTMLVLKERQSKLKDAVRATEVMHRVGISILGLIVTESDYYAK